MSTKHSTKLDEEKLSFACDLINGIQGSNLEKFRKGLEVVQFGNIAIQDLLDYLEATGDMP